MNPGKEEVKRFLFIVDILEYEQKITIAMKDLVHSYFDVLTR